MMITTRRSVLKIAATTPLLFAAACTTTIEEKPKATNRLPKTKMPFGPEPDFPDYAVMYAGVKDGGFNVPPIPYKKIPEQYLRQVVRDTTGERAGSIIVDTRRHYLYLVLGNGNAVRYGVGLGRAGFEWSGRAVMQWKRKWPTWTPPTEMIERQPELEKYSAANGGMQPGLKNPLGARAHYIFQDGKDTLYRLHGSPEWSSIGKSVSSGCVRLMNQDVIDLYTRAYSGAPILVK